MKQFKLIFLSLLLFSLTNCTNDDEELIEENLIEDSQSLKKIEINEVVEEILKRGYNLEEIIETNEFYLVQGDLLFSKKIEDYISIQTRQARVAGLVSPSNITSMTVYVDPSIPSSGTDNWRPAIISAINNWNDISECNVRFIYTTNSNADIKIKKANWGSNHNNTLAAAGFPTAGQPWHTILINLNFDNNNNVSESSKKYNMAHELGHTIGFRHTNWANLNESTGITIPGTPNSDPSSVMNGRTASFSWNGFSNYDKIAARYLYPTPAWVGLPRAYTRNPDPTICARVFVQNYDYKLPVSPGADTYTLRSNSPNLYVNGSAFSSRTVQPNTPIEFLASAPGNYTATLTTSNSYGSKTATIYVKAENCNFTIDGPVGF
ncbi:M57 family metalloprotease [uncultured Dokdonia sp.]|uniref:M57 family metalloprotease n=1 Tax=uncultured Dokdonia sp. TaxID=575653 RepID=UPI0030EDC1B3|tara:strand:- start:1326 stop:2459 length:1134 start_codon:yes stop_codon:yes gene_type:complete